MCKKMGLLGLQLLPFELKWREVQARSLTVYIPVELAKPHTAKPSGSIIHCPQVEHSGNNCSKHSQLDNDLFFLDGRKQVEGCKCHAVSWWKETAAGLEMWVFKCIVRTQQAEMQNPTERHTREVKG